MLDVYSVEAHEVRQMMKVTIIMIAPMVERANVLLCMMLLGLMKRKVIDKLRCTRRGGCTHRYATGFPDC